MRTAILMPFAAAFIFGTATVYANTDADSAATTPEYNVELGLLTCRGEGGWGAIITSKKTFACSFDPAFNEDEIVYNATIRKFGLDLGTTSDSTLRWLVVAPSETDIGEFEAAALSGTYLGVGAEATVGGGVGANLLVGGGGQAFGLQPLSAQTQTGLNVAAGVQSMQLDWAGN
ncbi:MAG: DUF992 domain-containing protein [Pseudomonadota bacterium]